jgi:hypothetical protein
MRQRHPHKETEAVLRYAESLGWTVVVGGSHAWGFLMCPSKRRGACNFQIPCTPHNPEGAAGRLKRKVNNCRCAETR